MSQCKVLLAELIRWGYIHMRHQTTATGWHNVYSIDVDRLYDDNATFDAVSRRRRPPPAWREPVRHTSSGADATTAGAPANGSVSAPYDRVAGAQHGKAPSEVESVSEKGEETGAYAPEHPAPHQATPSPAQEPAAPVVALEASAPITARSPVASATVPTDGVSPPVQPVSAVVTTTAPARPTVTPQPEPEPEAWEGGAMRGESDPAHRSHQEPSGSVSTRQVTTTPPGDAKPRHDTVPANSDVGVLDRVWREQERAARGVTTTRPWTWLPDAERAEATHVAGVVRDYADRHAEPYDVVAMRWVTAVLAADSRAPLRYLSDRIGRLRDADRHAPKPPQRDYRLGEPGRKPPPAPMPRPPVAVSKPAGLPFPIPDFLKGPDPRATRPRFAA